MSVSRRTLKPEAVNELLNLRAKRVSEQRTVEAKVDSVALFRRAGQLFGVPLEAMRYGWRSEQMLEVPGAPKFVSGLANGEGIAVTVVDLAVLYSLPTVGVSDIKYVLVVESLARRIGLACEVSLGVRELPVESVRPAPDPRGALKRSSTWQGQPVLLVDIPTLLADPRLAGRSGGGAD